MKARDARRLPFLNMTKGLFRGDPDRQKIKNEGRSGKVYGNKGSLDILPDHESVNMAEFAHFKATMCRLARFSWRLCVRKCHWRLDSVLRGAPFGLAARRYPKRFWPVAAALVWIGLLLVRPVSAVIDQGCAAQVARVQALTARGLFSQAQAASLAGLDSCPQNPQLYDLLGIAYDEQGQYPQARAAYQKAIALSPQTAAFHNNLAVSYYRAGEQAKAIAEFRTAFQLDPHNQFAALNLAKYELDQRHYRQALRYFQIAGAAGSHDPALLLGFAEACWGAGDSQAGLQAITSLDQLAGADASVHFSAGRLLAEHGQYVAAVKEFESIPATDRDFATYQNLGLAYSHLGRFEEAKTAFQAAARLDPSNPEPCLQLGRSAAVAGQLTDAVYWLTQAQTRAPQRTDIASDLAQALVQARQFDRAQELLSQALQSAPHDPALLKSEGDLNAAQHRDEPAIGAYRQSLTYAPRRADTRVALAKLYQQMNRQPEAKAEFEQVLRASPDDPEANAALGRMALKAGEIPTALTFLKKALDKDPDSLDASEDLATIELRQGSAPRAEAILGKLVRLDPDNPRFHYLLGQALSKEGKKGDAQREFNRSQELMTERAKTGQ